MTKEQMWVLETVSLHRYEVITLVDYLEGRCVRELAQPVIDKLIKEVSE